MNIYASVAGDEAVILRLKEYPDKFRVRLNKVVERLAIQLQGKIVAEKLSGQVLNNKTGTLRRSINYRIENSDNEITAIVGANTPYAARHEYGFHGTESVRGFIRRLKSGKTSQVNPHTRNINYAARSYLRSSLAEMKVEILTQLSQVTKEG